MLFLVRMTVAIPTSADQKEVASLKMQERERALELQRSGMWVSLWRVVGRYENYSIFEVRSNDELHDILSTLPLFPFMQVSVTALAHHPSAL